MNSFLLFVLSGLWLTPSLVFAREANKNPDFVVEKVISGLKIPWAIQFAPNGLLWINERHGQISTYDFKKEKLNRIFRIKDLYSKGQGGLLDLSLPENPKQ